MSAAPAAPIVFRADANAVIGVGHVMRCLALAEALQMRGAVCRFASRALPTGVARRLAEAGVERVHLAEDLPPLVDAAATLAATEETSWIVADGYGFDAGYQRALKSCGNPLLAFHDGQAMEAFPADVIVNPNIEAHTSIYRGVEAQLALGLSFLPLRKPFWQARRPARFGRPRILVTLGGADPDGMTAMVAKALAPLGDAAELIVLIGPANRDRDLVEASLPPSATVLSDVDDMAALLSGATLVVAAAGITMWEAMACGAAVIALHRDPLQAAAVEAAAAQHLLAGHFDANTLDGAALHTKALGWLSDEGALAALVARAAQAIDGQGALRCADLMLRAARRQAA